ncbi:uro-adherence factor A [Trachinotus anak]|uniref:uro-adherence factor A n=1 Tax=Trachinotus anak TaxID=443729 RepID=UPI0039F16BFA
MEFVGQPRLSGACNLLGVPGLSSVDLDDDEGEVVIGIRPKSSPLPRRRSSVTDEDSEPEPPLSGSRRVSFADAKGLSLVQVKEFDTWDVPLLPGCDSSEGEGKEAEEYFLSPHTFSLPLSTEELCIRVREQKVELESINLLPGTTILRGVICVLNISFSKAVYIRTTLDAWSSHFDLLAEYIPGSGDGLMDRFSFKLTLVPPFGEQGARVDFCLRYETPVGTFWANNNNKNYVLFCHQRTKDKAQRENVNKKSCLKTVSQNFSSVENISATEASPQENISAVVTKHGEEVNNMKAKQLPDRQAGTSEEDGQKLKTESRRYSSRRSRRKAARMARVKDYFAQRDGGVNDTERDESPPEAKLEAQKEEKPKEKHSDVQLFSEGSSKSERSQVVSESQESCSESLLDALPDTSPAHDSTSVSETEKSESSNLADSATLTGGESATDIPDNPVHSDDESAPGECRNINKSVSDAEGKGQEEGRSYECTKSPANEPVGSVTSAVISENLVSQATSFTFGTVVAPLYHQMFGRVGSESQSVGDGGNPVQATLTTGGLTQYYPHTERKESSCTVPTHVRNDSDNVQANVIKMQESNQDGLDATPPTEENRSLSMTEGDALDQADTLQDPGEITHSEQRCTNTSEDPKPQSGDPHTVDILHADLLSAQIPTQSLHLQGEAQEDNLTCDPQNQTTAETAQAQLPENTYLQMKTSVDTTLSQSEAQEVRASLESLSLHVSDETNQRSSGMCVDESNMEDDSGETITASTPTASSEADNLFKSPHDLNPNEINLSATKETANSCISHCEIVEEKDFSTLDTSLQNQEVTKNVEEQNKLTINSYEDETKHSAEDEVGDEVNESLTKEMMNNYHTHADVFTELKDKDTLEEEPIIVSEKIEHREMEAAVLKQLDFSLVDTTEVKNWEMMVEEDERNILTDQEESETISLKAVEDDQGGQLEDAGMETALDTTEMEKEKTREELVEEVTAAGENRTKAEEAVRVEDEERGGEEGIWETVAGKDGEDIEKELESVQDRKTEKTAAEEEAAEETEVEKREEEEEAEVEKEKCSEEMQEVSIKRTNVQEEEEIDEEEEMEIDSNSGAGVVWGDQVKPREEHVEEENPNHKEEIVVDEAGDSEIVDADSGGMTIEDGEDEVGCFEERLDITQSRPEGGLSAPVSVQDKSVIDKERKGGSAHVPTEMHLYKEGDFQSSENVPHDRSKAENESCAAEGDSCILTDEPENDQISLDSASAESDSDDEVELYMHCLRAVHTGEQAAKDRNKDTGFSVGKRPSVSRSKRLSTPMPSISESLDEEQPLSCFHEGTDVTDIQPTIAALPLSSGQESISRNVSWWRETFSCNNISNTLLYTTLLVVFLVVAYHYDFLACFGLYLISVVWLCCQGERPPVKDNNRIG